MNMIKKVFVTGADGMLGSSICRVLIKFDYNVKAMVLPKRKSKVLLGLSLEIVEGNILDKKFLEKEMKDCDGVIHAAALTTVWPRRSEIVLKVNFDGTKNVMEVAEKYSMKRMVHIGSASSFKHGPKEEPGDETTSFDGWKFGMDYIDSKYFAQKMLLEKYSRDKFPVIIINPTYMIGPFDSAPSSGKMLVELLSNRIPGYSKGGKNFVCSTDVATAAVNALTYGRLGECYIVGNENLEYGEFFKKACSVRNINFNLFKMPNSLIMSFGFMSSMVAQITRKPPKLSYAMARFAGVGQYFSSEKAQLELNISRTPIENGIEQCVSWFESNGYLR